MKKGFTQRRQEFAETCLPAGRRKESPTIEISLCLCATLAALREAFFQNKTLPNALFSESLPKLG